MLGRTAAPGVFVLAIVIAIGSSPLGTRAGQGAARAATPDAGASAVVVASGLTNPRGLAFGADGVLHVGLAGALGSTTGVVAVAEGCPRTVVDEVPTARVAFGVAGVADVAFLDGQLFALIAGGDIDRGRRPNGLYRVEASGELALVADISAFIRDNPVTERPRDYDTDGQPYAMMVAEDGFLVTEGNSNQLLRVGLDGRVRRVADLSRDHPIPTGIAPTGDGGVYVAYFTRVPYAEGTAKVVAVRPDGGVTEVWTGLSLVTALAVDAAGELYALEMATGHGADPAAIASGTGRVVRRTGPDTAEVVATGLALPVAMEFGPDGALYVATPAFGADDGQGVIVRVDLSGGGPVPVPEGLAAPSCA